MLSKARPIPRLDLQDQDQDRDFNIWVSRRVQTKTQVSRTTLLAYTPIVALMWVKFGTLVHSSMPNFTPMVTCAGQKTSKSPCES